MGRLLCALFLHAQVWVGGITATKATLGIWDTSVYITCATLKDHPLRQKKPPLFVTLDSLLPSTTYTYTLTLSDGKVITGRFETAPLPTQKEGRWRFGFGSCSHIDGNPMETRLLRHAQKRQPRLFFHLGDWGYPDTTENNFPPETKNFFTCDSARVREAYQKRYYDPAMQPIFLTCGVDYVYDDHDYVADNGGKNFRPYYNLRKPPKKESFIGDYAFDPRCRLNALRGYQVHVPHYPLVDSSEGLYHRVRWGPVEFFFLDTRSARSGNMSAFVKEGKMWRFRPDRDHSLLGEKQRQWLLSSLGQSTAHWKIILSGVTYNRSLRSFIDTAMAHQPRNFRFFGGLFKLQPIFFAGFVADTWSGYPVDQDTLYRFCKEKSLVNVIFISGDTHTGTIEDGVMGGFPELMSSGLAEGEKRTYYLSKMLGYNFFTGGCGITVDYFGGVYGEMEVYGTDSLALRLIDTSGKVIAERIYRSPITVSPIPDRVKKPNLALTFRASKTAQGIKVEFPLARQAPLLTRLHLFHPASQKAQSWLLHRKQLRKGLSIDMQAMPPGSYVLYLEGAGSYYGMHLPWD
ncbi:MAG: alkaline phosphatase D family protein [Bacteroidia bacterium]